VRQLAAALSRASLLAARRVPFEIPREQAHGQKNGSKLPHSKASLRDGRYGLLPLRGIISLKGQEYMQSKVEGELL
jgi:hypothetical protein